MAEAMLKSVRANVAYLSHMEKHGHLLLHAKQILETVKEVDRLVVNHNMLYKDIVAFTGLSDSKLLRFHKFAKYPCLQEAAAQGLLTVRGRDEVKLHYADGDAPKTVQDLRTLGVVTSEPPPVPSGFPTMAELHERTSGAVASVAAPAASDIPHVEWVGDGKPKLGKGVKLTVFDLSSTNNNTNSVFTEKGAFQALQDLLKHCGQWEVHPMAGDVNKWMGAIKRGHRLIMVTHGAYPIAALYQDVVTTRHGEVEIPHIRVYLVRDDAKGKGYGRLVLREELQLLQGERAVVADVAMANPRSRAVLEAAAGFAGRHFRLLGWIHDESGELAFDESDQAVPQEGEDHRTAEYIMELAGHYVKAELIKLQKDAEASSSRKTNNSKRRAAGSATPTTPSTTPSTARSTARSTGTGKQLDKIRLCRKLKIVGDQVVVRNTKRHILKGTSRISVLEKLLADKDVPDQYVAIVQQAIAAATNGTGKKRKT